MRQKYNISPTHLPPPLPTTTYTGASAEVSSKPIRPTPFGSKPYEKLPPLYQDKNRLHRIKRGYYIGE